MKLLVLLSFLTVSCFGERILFLGLGSKSHKIGFMPIAKGLADKGHQVTVVNAFPGLASSDNVHEIIVQDISNEFNVDWFQMQKESAFFKVKWVVTILQTAMTRGYDVLMANEEFRQVIRDADVDFVVQLVSNDIALPIIDSLKVPFAFYIPQTASSISYDAMQIPREYASVPSTFLSFNSDMSFFQRLLNMFSSEFLLLMRRILVDRTADQHVKQDFPDARSITELRHEASLWFMNHHVTTAYPRPLPPNVIPTGALHVRPANPLPRNMQQLADESADGFIVFTLGSIVSGSSVPDHLMQIFVNVFSKSPQRVFWKREKSTGIKLPSNVVLLDWIPQQDLIAHPNCRLLITHGGLMSLQEAIYHKMPFLGLPFGTDQHSNLARASKEGYAIKLDWDKLDEQSLSDAMSSLINDPSYRINAERMSDLMRDELAPGTDVAVYWIEHVLRHGATHLQPASKKLNFVQKNLIDVWLFVTAVLAITVASMWLMLRWLCRSLKKPSNLNSSTGDSSSTSSAPIHEESGGE